MLTLVGARERVAARARRQVSAGRASCAARASAPLVAAQIERLGVRTPSAGDARRRALGRQPAEGPLRARAARRAARAAGRRADARRRRRRPHRPLPGAARGRRRRSRGGRALLRRGRAAGPVRPRARVLARAASCASSRATQINEENITGAAVTSAASARPDTARARGACSACAASSSGDYLPSVVLALLIVAGRRVSRRLDNGRFLSQLQRAGMLLLASALAFVELRPADRAADGQHRPLGRAADGR